jgi:hypothetical protein
MCISSTKDGEWGCFWNESSAIVSAVDDKYIPGLVSFKGFCGGVSQHGYLSSEKINLAKFCYILDMKVEINK